MAGDRFSRSKSGFLSASDSCAVSTGNASSSGMSSVKSMRDIADGSPFAADALSVTGTVIGDMVGCCSKSVRTDEGCTGSVSTACAPIADATTPAAAPADAKSAETAVAADWTSGRRVAVAEAAYSEFSGSISAPLTHAASHSGPLPCVSLLSTVA